MVSDVGGFGGFLNYFFLLMVGSYANRMFFASLIQDMFRVRLSTDGAEINVLKKAKTTVRKRRN